MTAPEKTCRICGVTKALDCFSKNKSRPDGKHYNCKPCDSAKARKWAADNPEKNKARAVAYREKNRARVLAMDRDRYWSDRESALANRKVYYLANTEKVKRNADKWQRNNPDRRKEIAHAWYRRNVPDVTARVAQRRASKISRTPQWLTAEQREEMRQMYLAARRKSYATGIKYHVDHIVPLRGDGVSGLHVPWNLQIIPAFDNLSKGKRVLPDISPLAFADAA